MFIAVRRSPPLWFVLAGTALALSAAPRPVGAGELRTLDGKTYEGEIRFDAAGQVTVAQRHGGQAVKIDPADLLQAHFRDDPHPRRAPAPGSLPVPWQEGDVGSVSHPGVVKPPGASGSVFNSVANGTFKIKASGADVGGRADSFHFFYQPMAGDGQIVARVADVQGAAPKVGLMVRERVEAGARQVSLLLTGDGISFLRRVEAGDEARAAKPRGGDAGNGAGDRAPVWLKLVRVGNALMAFKSADGAAWQAVGGVEMKLPADALIGLAVCSRNPAGYCTASFEEVAVAGKDGRDRARDNPPPAGAASAGKAVLLRSGTLFANASLQSADAAKVQFAAHEGKNYAVPTSDVARVVFRSLTRQQAERIPERGAGVLLKRGDFIEGELRSFDGGQVRVSSVLFGLNSFNADDVSAVVFADAGPPASAPYLVRATDGSLYAARSLKFEAGAVTVEDAAAGAVRLEAWRLIEIKAGGARFDPLTSLRPAKVDAPPGLDAASAYLTDAAPAGLPASLDGSACEHAASLAAGAAAHYDLAGRYKVFFFRCGVPDGVPPAVSVRLAVLGDGKELYRSPPLTSLEEAATVSLNVAGVKTLTLKVENAGGGKLPARGTWGDAELVK